MENKENKNDLTKEKNLLKLQKTVKSIMVAMAFPIIVLIGLIIYKVFVSKNNEKILQSVNKNNIVVNKKHNTLENNFTNLIPLNIDKNCNFTITYQSTYIALYSKECSLLITINPTDTSTQKITQFNLK